MKSKPILLIPIAGFGSRFVEAGFETPKQMLIPQGQTLSCLELSLSSVVLDEFELIFIIRQSQAEAGFVDFIRRIAGLEAQILILEAPTREYWHEVIYFYNGRVILSTFVWKGIRG